MKNNKNHYILKCFILIDILQFYLEKEYQYPPQTYCPVPWVLIHTLSLFLILIFACEANALLYSSRPPAIGIILCYHFSISHYFNDERFTRFCCYVHLKENIPSDGAVNIPEVLSYAFPLFNETLSKITVSWFFIFPKFLVSVDWKTSVSNLGY